MRDTAFAREYHRAATAHCQQDDLMRSRHMALTPEHVAQVHRVLEDPGPNPTWTYHTDEDYHALVQGLLASHPGGPDTWLFAYGSLIWKPSWSMWRRGGARPKAGTARSASGSSGSVAPESNPG
jgi:hypothetical protein